MQTELLDFLFHRSSRLVGRSQILNALTTVHARPSANRHGYALVLFSIDRFKMINSRFGPARADTVLRRVAAVAVRTLGRRGLIGRWGGDEFLCMLPDADAVRAAQFSEQLRQRIAELIITVDAHITAVTCSFGVACYRRGGGDIRDVLAAADAALQEAKRTGRNRVSHASAESVPAPAIGGLLETALREERVMPAYQPIFDLESGRMVAEEALARIVTTDEKIMPASEFIEAASRFQLTHRIDSTVIVCALQRLAVHSARGHNRIIFVNVSGGLLHHPEIIKELTAAAHQAAAHGNARGRHGLVIEITERELLDDLDEARRVLAPLANTGLGLALDDFGSGYSSLHYLADLPVSYLKIDGRLVKRLHESRIRAIIRGIQSTASELGLTTLAEYVEHERQANVLREIGINWGQGHYFGKAMVDESEASTRRHLSVNWAQGYYYREPGSG